MSLRASSLSLLLLAMLSFTSFARADSLAVTYWFSPNIGTSNNAAAYITGPGTLINTGGNTGGCPWCSAGTAVAPGGRIDLSVSYLDFGSYFTGTLNGAAIDPNNFSIQSTFLTVSTFTFPLFHQGGLFTITLPASMGTIHLFNGTQTQAFGVIPGQLTLTFLFTDQSGPNPTLLNRTFSFQSGEFSSVVTPEPQTLVLFGSGLLMLSAASFRKYRESLHLS